MQDRSPPEHRGAILAASNFLTFGGMLIASIGYGLLRQPVDGEAFFTSREIFLMCGIATVPVFIYIILLIPQATIKFLAWLLTHSVYRIHVYGRENIPEQGGAILVPNHISWLDGLLMFATSSRQVRMLIDAELLDTWRAHGFARLMGGIPIKPSPKSTKRAIETVARSGQGRRAGLHLSRGRHQPLGSIAAVQAGRARDSARHGRADHSRVARRNLGQHLQLSRRQVFLEVAEREAAPGFDLVRQTDLRSARYSHGAAGSAGPGGRRGHRSEAAHCRPAPCDDSQLPQVDVSRQARPIRPAWS